MVEKFAWGLAREGPVWGLPKEVSHLVSRPPQRTAVPEPEPKGAPVAPKAKETAGKPRKGNYWRSKGQQGDKAPKKTQPKGEASGPSKGNVRPNDKPRATPKGGKAKDPRPSRDGKKGKF